MNRYEIRKDLAERRKRQHGRFVKSSKKSITELAKAYKGAQSMTNSAVTIGSPMVTHEGMQSRKSSFHDIAQSMAKMNIFVPRPPDTPHYDQKPGQD